MIDWDFAVATASRLAGPGPVVSRDEADEVVAELRAGARPLDAAGARVHRAGRRRGGTADVLVVDRPGLDPGQRRRLRAGHHAARRQAPGAQGRSDRAVRGRRLPGHRRSRSARCSASWPARCSASSTRSTHRRARPRSGRLLLVAPNIVHAERELGVDPTRLPALGLPARGDPPGAVHRRALDARPHPQRDRQHRRHRRDRPGQARRDRRRRRQEASATWSAARSDASHRSTCSPPRRSARSIDRITGVMSLLEGHADVVMDGVGPEVIPIGRRHPREVQPAPQGRRLRSTALAPPAARPRRQDGAVPQRRRASSAASSTRSAWRASTRCGSSRPTCRPRTRSATPQPGCAGSMGA